MSTATRRIALNGAATLGLMALGTATAFAAGLAAIADNDTVVLRGNVHPLVQSRFDVGPVEPSMPMERMILALSLRPEKRAALERLLEEQQDPASTEFHRWLTPDEFGRRFGATPEEIGAVTAWLNSRGFTIDEVGRGRTSINFTGTAGDVERAFHTRMRYYVVDDELHHANATDPEIPRSLAGLVAGVVSLHDFPSQPMHTPIRRISPDELRPNFNSVNGAHYLAPADFATIYNVNPLYAAGIDGRGQTIAIVGRTNILLSDVQTFRADNALPANDPQFIINGPDPGIVAADEGEADLDVEWSGAVARAATVEFVITKSTTSDGVDLSAQYIVNNNLAPIMSTSYGQCEATMGTAKNTFYSNLWAQAAAQGITSFVSSDDTGASGCNGGNDTTGNGLAVNGLCSTPYNVCVGGTEFLDTANPAAYWAPTNDPVTSASALSYIPEAGWNEGGAAAFCLSGTDCAGLWSSGGGVSSVYAKPSWQAAPGVPADGARDVPDVALAAAFRHDAYLYRSEGQPSSVGGTSAASPSFAGLMALLVQATGSRQGNADTRLYQLGSAQYGTAGAQVFHDVTTGDNSVPGVTGYGCGPAYDLATGLGSVDATALVNIWTAGSHADFAVASSPTSVVAVQGFAGTAVIRTTISGGFNANVALSVSGLPGGASADFSPASIPAPGSGSSTLTLTAGTTTPTGTFTVTVAGSGGSTTHTTTISFTVAAATTGTVTVFSDDFEGSFPGSWQLYRNSSAQPTDWGRVTCKSAGGRGSAWCAAGGSAPQPPCTQYAPGMSTWLYYGPFSLADASAASAEFDIWLDTETYDSTTQKGDRLWWLVSTDGINFSGYYISGNTGGWTHEVFDFSDVTSVTAAGAQQVWFAFVFTSDATVNGGGAFVDNVVIRKVAGGSAGSAYSAWVGVTSHTAGANGSQWRSDLGVLNSSSATANLQVALFTPGGVITGTAAVAAGSQAIFQDIVGQLGFTGSGALEVLSDQTVVVTSRTYNQSGSGTFGQDYASSSPALALSTGGSALLPQLAEDAAYRTNISLTNTGLGAATVTVVLYDGAGNTLTSYDVSLGPGEWKQQNRPFSALAGQSNMNAGYAVVTVTSGSGVVASASVIDNVTNDPTTIGVTTGSTTDAWVPVSSHAPGANGSQWRSDLGVLNPNQAAANVTVILYTSGGTISGTAAVPGGNQAVFADILGQLGFSGSGALEVTSDQPVVMTSRTYNQSANGTFGQDYASYGSASTLGTGQSAWLPQLTESAAYRTNISLTNTGSVVATVTVTLFDGAGNRLRSYSATLNPGEWQQQNRPFWALAGQSAMDRGYAVVTVTAGSGVVASASVIDNLTNDPTTIAMVR